jgi:hypothetical protein
MPSLDERSLLAPSTVTVSVPLTIAGKKCPVRPDNAVAWTQAERLVASQAPEMESVEALVSN